MTLRTTTSPIKKRGFTLVELLVVIAVMAILASIVVPVTIHYIDDAQQAADTVYTQDVAAWATSVIIDLRARQGSDSVGSENDSVGDNVESAIEVTPANVCREIVRLYGDQFPYALGYYSSGSINFDNPGLEGLVFIDSPEGFDKTTGDFIAIALTSGTLTVSRIADLLEITEKDVVRALNYWKKQGLLEYESAPESGPASSSLPSDVPDIRQYRSRKEFKELLFVAEQYLGKTLSATDIEAITYFYETLHMSADLIEYLIEYCVENGHKSIHYIQKVALSWHEQEFHTVEEAKAGTQAYNRNCYSVLNAYGIKGRSPATSEIAYIRKWNEEYGFALEIILEACARTMNKIHQPSFEYTDSILKSWLAQNVHSLKDVEALDTAYYKEKERKKRPAAKASSNKFNNFDSRSYDMNDLERKLVQQ